MDFEYAGTYMVDSTEFYMGKYKLSKSPGKWYILLASDTSEISKARSQMELLAKKDFKLLWMQHPNDFYSYLQGDIEDEFLPDGTWLNYIETKEKGNVSFERTVKNRKLVKKYIMRNENGNIQMYFEIENDKLNGLVFYSNFENEDCIKVIDIFQKGDRVNRLYIRE